MKTYWGSAGTAHAFSTSALGEGEWSAWRSGRFISREGAPGTHWIGGWVGPRAGLGVMVKTKSPSRCWDWNPDHPARSPALYHWAIPAQVKFVPVLNQVSHHEYIWGVGAIAPKILNLCTRWRSVTSFRLRSLYVQEKASVTHWIGSNKQFGKYVPK
jgi:hypothetical protein